MRAFFLAALLFFTSCASAPCHNADKDYIDIHRTIGAITSSVTLLAPRDVNDGEAALLLEAARAHASAFEKDFGQSIKPVKVYLLRGFSIPCGPDHTRRYIGCYKTRINRIFVTMGYRYQIPALYHEFVHRTLLTHDVMHKDPRWEGEWKESWGRVNAKVIKNRARLDLHKVRWGIK